MRKSSLLCALFIAACGSSQPSPPTLLDAPTAPRAVASAPMPAAEGRAHSLLLLSAGCWFGGLWSDAEGASPDQRVAAGGARCMQLASQIGSSGDLATYDRLRELEPATVDKLYAEIEKRAKDGGVEEPRRH